MYAGSETTLLEPYSSFKSNEVVQKYPHFITHVESLMDKAKEWAHCHRKCMMIRENHTNNYAEAGIRSWYSVELKLIIILWCNVSLCRRYHGQLLSAKPPQFANNRLKIYVALRFKGVNTKKIVKEDIQKGKDNWYRVCSQSKPSTWYDVNPTIGLCTCTQGRDGSPCSHQAVIPYWLKHGYINTFGRGVETFKH